MKVQLSKRIIVEDVPEGQPLDPVTIRNAMLEWRAEQTRYQTLFRYYIGQQDFSEAHADGNKIVANFCQYIAKTLQGYMFGNRPTYTCAEGDAQAQEIIDAFRRQEMWLTDSKIGLDMSIYGKAFELVYLPKGKDEPRSMLVHPTDGFVAYAGDLERDSVFGAVYFHFEDQNQTPMHTLYTYDRAYYCRWQSTSLDGPWTMIEGPIPHGFGRVPLIEYRNSEEMIGDFEGIMDLQDAYNGLLSDRQDDKDAFANAMLMLQGAIIGVTADEIEDGKVNLKKRRVLQLDDDATAAWLTKTMDETSIQVMQDQYAGDIHKLAMVPDLSDELFAGNASGIAMAYKLFGTDQMVAEKVEQFRMGFRRRCKLYDYRMHNPTLNPAYKPQADLSKMDVTLNPNTPQDVSYMATALTQLTAAGIVSKDTARRNLSIVDDPEEEAKRVEDEQRAEGESMSSAFEDPFGGARPDEGDMSGGSAEGADE